MIFTPSSRARVHAAERHWAIKFTLRLITIGLALIAIGISAYTLSPAFQNAQDNFLDSGGLLWLALIPLCMSVLWNIANVVVRLCRARPVHPGANVALDLLTLIAFCILGATAIVGAISHIVYSANGISQDLSNGKWVYAPNGTAIWGPNDLSLLTDCPGYASCLQYQVAQMAGQFTINNLGVYQIVAVAFMYMLIFLHLILFIWACVDTHQRRKGLVPGRSGKTRDPEQVQAYQPTQAYQQALVSRPASPPPARREVRLARDSDLYGESPQEHGREYTRGSYAVEGPGPWAGTA
ncbi:hypothetical protein MMC13_002118 [Lambiella insularis]|nr:hypothetical protein [Lambiella insularis]